MMFFFTPLHWHGIFLGRGRKRNIELNLQIVKNTCFLTSFEGHIWSLDLRPGYKGLYALKNCYMQQYYIHFIYICFNGFDVLEYKNRIKPIFRSFWYYICIFDHNPYKQMLCLFNYKSFRNYRLAIIS